MRHMRCPECGRIASVPDRCKRPICVHAWTGSAPEIWDGDDTNGEGRTVEQSPNEPFRSPGPKTWAAMVPARVAFDESQKHYDLGYNAGHEAGLRTGFAEGRKVASDDKNN